MSILINKDTKVLVQGLTGKTGTFHTEQALAYHGTKMVGGIHPKKGGETWEGSGGDKLPIFASVAEGKDATGANASVIYVPPAGAASAIIEAIDALDADVDAGALRRDAVIEHGRVRKEMARLAGELAEPLLGRRAVRKIVRRAEGDPNAALTPFVLDALAQWHVQPEMLRDAADTLGADRPAAVCRELTKRFEECRQGSLGDLADHYADAPPKGEIVVLIGRGGSEKISELDIDRSLSEALQTMSVRDAADTVSAMYGVKRRPVYQRAMVLSREDGQGG